MTPIDCIEIQDLVRSGKPVLCIDVRETFRHATMDAGGWKIPYNEVNRHTARLRPFVDSVVVICCLRPKGSKRAEIAALALRKMGFTNVRELKNGLYSGWIQKVGRNVKLPAPAQTAVT